MNELELLCEQALYEEIRNLGDGKSIVRDVPTGRLFYRKVLTVYNTQVFAYLKDHKSRYVPRIESFREDGETLIVIEEFVQGRTLHDILENEDEPLPFQERIRILTEICDGLSFLHSAHPPIIHRDLKASNIMLTEDGVVKIIDYDAAKIYVRGEKKDTVLMGTHGVAAPEQYGFAPSDVRTDIFALGKLIERMLPDNVDAARIVARATHIDPKKRYSSAAMVKDQIVRIREKSSNLDTRLEKAIPGFDPRSKAHRILGRASILLLCAAVLAGIGFAVWRLTIYPEKRSAAFRGELAVIEEGRAENDEIIDVPEAIGTFLTRYPYNRMSDEEQQSFRSAVEKAISKYPSTDSESKDRILSILEEKCGDEAETILAYAEAEKLLYTGSFADALEKLRPLRAAGATDAEERWEDAVRRCMDKADACAETFYKNKENQTSSAGKAMELYETVIFAIKGGNQDTGSAGGSTSDSAVQEQTAKAGDAVSAEDNPALVPAVDKAADPAAGSAVDKAAGPAAGSAVDQAADPSVDPEKISAEDRKTADEAEASHNQVFGDLLDLADTQSRDGDIRSAETLYQLLMKHQKTAAAAQTDLDERILANKYRDGESRLAKEAYEYAYKIFLELGDYKDSGTKAAECQYLIAGKNMKEKEYRKAVEAYKLCPGYKDADDRLFEAMYTYCKSVEDKPDDEAYAYIKELTDKGYPGAEQVHDTMLQWHAEIETGINYHLGSQQSAAIRVTLYGGPPDTSIHLRLDTIDNVNGEHLKWTSPDAYARGEKMDAYYSIDTFEYSIFEREFTVNIYDESGNRIGTWTGIFPMEFLKD